MRVTEKTDTRLVFVDDQRDKKSAVGLGVAGLLFLAWQFLFFGDWIVAGVPVLIILGLLGYLHWSRMRSVLTFDKTANRIDLEVFDRTGRRTWDWALSDVDTAELSEIVRPGDMRDNGLKQPMLVLKNGTRVPLRPYHSAGGASFDTVAAIQHFLGQPITGAPVGWLNPYEDG